MMKMDSRRLGIVMALMGGALCILAPLGAAGAEHSKQAGIDRAAGLEAWARIYEVASHPRCSNCHTGKAGIPMWSGPSYGEARPHGMGIKAGESRVGAEYLPCSACHIKSTRTQVLPHAAPRANADWQLAPAGAGWFGRSSRWICEQMRDPARNGGMDHKQLANHASHDVILQWAWAPGPGREPAPYSIDEHTADILEWGAAGQPCPD